MPRMRFKEMLRYSHTLHQLLPITKYSRDVCQKVTYTLYLLEKAQSEIQTIINNRNYIKAGALVFARCA